MVIRPAPLPFERLLRLWADLDVLRAETEARGDRWPSLEEQYRAREQEP